MNIIFILVEPAVPENVGAAARAIKVMGFSQLRMVNGCDHLDKSARRLAHGSNEILEKAKIFNSFSDAIADCDFIIGTTARARISKHDYHTPETIVRLIESKKDTIQNVAVCFGREEHGLLNDEVKLCDAVSRIPMKRKYPSLNLAQAVMVYAYELSTFSLEPASKKYRKPDASEFKALKANMQRLLEAIELAPPAIAGTRIFERLSLLTEMDVRLVHSVCNQVMRRINNDYVNRGYKPKISDKE
jgi:tRNA/rRNA methyltransferase